MLAYPDIDPVAFSLGPVEVHWYGLMYLLGFAAAYILLTWRAKKPDVPWQPQQVGDIIFYGAVGVILGGRIGYTLFYNFSGFLANPLGVFYVWEGGMSFHGGLLGVLLALWLYGRTIGKTMFDLTDFVAPIVPIGLGLGRLGNFIGGELWGRATNLPWAMVFPRAGDLPRHPSQLYQACLEGLVLFVILWWYSSKPRPRYAVSGMFAFWYGIFRFSAEFVRQPDAQLGFVAFDWLTMGQLLSLPLILLGAFVLFIAYRRTNIGPTG
jgi:phosphatidylglycerol:prolipoprotein diacylglycerol transferase